MYSLFLLYPRSVSLSWFCHHVTPKFILLTWTVLCYKSKVIIRSLLWISCYLPARNNWPISSLRPIVSKSITATSSAHSRICSQGTLNSNVWKQTNYFLSKIKICLEYLVECRVKITLVDHRLFLLNLLVPKHQPHFYVRI